MSINTSKTDVLVFAAHPDDDILGLGTVLYRHVLNGESVKVVFVTNGTAGNGESWYRSMVKAKNRAKLRFQEATLALAQIGVSQANIYCLGFPDAGTQRYLEQMSGDISMLLKKLEPKRVYVHCIEGGHIDHDMTSFVVKSVCLRIGYPNVFEFTQYNSVQPIGTEQVKFLSNTSEQVDAIEISNVERKLKRRMLSFHHSQGVEKYYVQGETIRKASLENLEDELEKYCQISNKCLVQIVGDFQMHLLKSAPVSEVQDIQSENHSM